MDTNNSVVTEVGGGVEEDISSINGNGKIQLKKFKYFNKNVSGDGTVKPGHIS